MGNMFQQATIPIENPAVFEPVKSAIDAAFASASVGKFLQRVERARLRVRDFEQVLHQGLLGDSAKTGYAQLGDSDRGQIREMYLRAVEQVAQEVRGKYLKVYAYY
ncbi:MAG: hypothetical protein ACYDC6_06815 [Acidobacteriaceae bacterium]